MKKIVTILAVALLCLGWYQTVDTVFRASSKYGAHMKEAEAYLQKEIFEDALSQYQAALEIKPDSVEAKLSIAKVQLKMDNKTDFISICEGLIYQKKADENALELLTDYYNNNGRQEDIVSMLKELRIEHGDEPKIQELWKKYRGCYEELYNSYAEMSPFYGRAAIASNGEGYFLINAQGENVFSQVYDDMMPFSKEARMVSVSENGAWYYINANGYKKIVPNEKYDFLGVFSDGITVVGKNKKYGYADDSMQLKTKCEWDSASNLHGGIAAVEKNGKWSLLGSDFTPLTDTAYEDVLIDEAGFCSGQERVFAKQKDGYHLLDAKGNAVGTLVFEDAKPFGEDKMTAVCIDGKWGFIDTAGELVIPCSYEDAKTFAYGIAPIKKNGVWGYVDGSGNDLIEPQFEDANPFNEDGIAPVKEGNWFLIRLYALQ